MVVLVRGSKETWFVKWGKSECASKGLSRVASLLDLTKKNQQPHTTIHKKPIKTRTCWCFLTHSWAFHRSPHINLLPTSLLYLLTIQISQFQPVPTSKDPSCLQFRGRGRGHGAQVTCTEARVLWTDHLVNYSPCSVLWSCWAAIT